MNSKEYDRAWRKKNPDKVAEKRRKFKAKNPQKYLGYFKERNTRMPSRYHGLPRTEVLAHLAKQGGVCAICETDSTGKGTWHGDHNHETGVFRGVLCPRCNMGLGLFRDSVALLDRAKKYLKRS